MSPVTPPSLRASPGTRGATPTPSGSTHRAWRPPTASTETAPPKALGRYFNGLRFVTRRGGRIGAERAGLIARGGRPSHAAVRSGPWRAALITGATTRPASCLSCLPASFRPGQFPAATTATRNAPWRPALPAWSSRRVSSLAAGRRPRMASISKALDELTARAREARSGRERNARRRRRSGACQPHGPTLEGSSNPLSEKHPEWWRVAPMTSTSSRAMRVRKPVRLRRRWRTS